MNKKIIYTIVFAIFGTMFMMSSSGGRAASANAGNTGAPGETATTCVTCHGGTSVTADIEIINSMGETVTSYVPGETYDITVSVSASGAAGYGFQMVSLIDNGNTDVAGFSSPSSNTQIATASGTGRQYAEQDGTSTSNTFNVSWTAPTSGSGDITFYAGANAVNGNGQTSGDGADLVQISLTEGFDSSISNKGNDFAFNMFPNPVRSELFIELGEQQGEFQARIMDVSGKMIQGQTVNILGGRTAIQVVGLPNGYYILNLTQGAKQASLPFIKE